MKKLLILLMLLLLSISIVVAQESTELTEEELEVIEDEAGMTPDSPLYGLELAMEQIRLRLTTNNEEKILLQMQYAQERVAEMRVLQARGKLGDVTYQRAEAVMSSYMQQARQNAADIKDPVQRLRIQEIIQERNQEREMELEHLSEEAGEQERERVEQTIRNQEAWDDEIEEETHQARNEVQELEKESRRSMIG